jgi:hypothetical protein
MIEQYLGKVYQTFAWATNQFIEPDSDYAMGTREIL